MHIRIHKLLVLHQFSNEFLAALNPVQRNQEEPMNPVEIEYADALMELCEEMSIKAISLWSAIQTRDDWLDDSFT